MELCKDCVTQSEGSLSFITPSLIDLHFSVHPYLTPAFISGKYKDLKKVKLLQPL